MEYYEELTYALKQLSVVQSFYHAGRLEAYKENCGSHIDCDEDFLYATVLHRSRTTQIASVSA